MRIPLIESFRPRIEASLERAGLDLPWWIPTFIGSVGAVVTVVAVAQRATILPPAVTATAGLLAMSTALVWVITGRLVPSWLKAPLVIAGVAILLLAPVLPDFAPVLLAALCAELGAIAGPALAVGAVGASVAVLAAAGLWTGLAGSAVYIAAIVLSGLAGATLRWYIRALEAERDKQEAMREQAALAERQRIAREVHDVVGHSLSITLLHLTGARRALQQDRDVDEAVEALAEAEQVGRTAMQDVRRAVGLLGTTSSRRALPGIDDIDRLVEGTRAAGVDVRYERHGEFSVVSSSAGLGLYRIAQESLANIAKHAPDSIVRFCLRVEPDHVRLVVRNRLPFGWAGPATNGSGLIGMRARATQLRAELRTGPEGEHWVVDVSVPCDLDAEAPRS